MTALRFPRFRRQGCLGLVVAIASVGSVSGCGVNDVRLAQDTRVEILSPRAGARVALPVTVELEVDGIELAPPGSADGHYFAVFVDRAPLRPGESILALVDDSCLEIGDGCANLEYFASKNVYLTAATTFDLANVPQKNGAHDQSRVNHHLTVVLMNSTHQRVGESAFITRFRVGEGGGSL